MHDGMMVGSAAGLAVNPWSPSNRRGQQRAGGKSKFSVCLRRISFIRVTRW